MTKVETIVTGESYTYEILWGCCQRQIAVAKESEKGSLYFLLTAMSMAYFTYEAYLNHALHKVVPEIYEDERTYFSGRDYSGTPGKLKKLCEIASVDFPEVANRPYQSIKMLQQLRDSVAHGKPYPFEVSVKHIIGHNPAAIPHGFEQVVTVGNAIRCIEDLKKFIRWLNAELIKKLPSCGLLIHPLNGFLGHSDADFQYES